MDDATIKSLREALNISPNNIPLKLHLAETLVQLQKFAEAEKEYQELLQLKNDDNIKLGLAKLYFKKGSFSTCVVITEELLLANENNLDAQLLLTRALVKENSLDAAIQSYQKLLSINPNFKDEELDRTLRVMPDSKAFDMNLDEDDFDFQNETESIFIQKPDVNFTHVGGMDNVKKEIDLKIIQPLLHPEIYKAYGKKIGGGILLYGPPGCGKTHIARATAGQVSANFISIGLNDILDMWLGSSERKLHDVFEMARANTPCVLFIDEIDALGASRSDMKQSAGRHVINQFLQELDGIENKNDGLLIMGATNTPWHLDTAFRRPGRFDRIIFVPPPDIEARASIFKIKLTNKPIESIDYTELAKKTPDYSGADIAAAIDIAIEEKLTQSFSSGIPTPLQTKDILKAATKHKATTKEWFVTAKNYALYANESGLYNEILGYLKINK